MKISQTHQAMKKQSHTNVAWSSENLLAPSDVSLIVNGVCVCGTHVGVKTHVGVNTHFKKVYFMWWDYLLPPKNDRFARHYNRRQINSDWVQWRRGSHRTVCAPALKWRVYIEINVWTMNISQTHQAMTKQSHTNGAWSSENLLAPSDVSLVVNVLRRYEREEREIEERQKIDSLERERERESQKKIVEISHVESDKKYYRLISAE